MGLAPFVNCYRACKLLLSLSGSVDLCHLIVAYTPRWLPYKTFQHPLHLGGHCMPFNIKPKRKVSIKLNVNIPMYRILNTDT